MLSPLVLETSTFVHSKWEEGITEVSITELGSYDLLYKDQLLPTENLTFSEEKLPQDFWVTHYILYFIVRLHSIVIGEDYDVLSSMTFKDLAKYEFS